MGAGSKEVVAVPPPAQLAPKQVKGRGMDRGALPTGSEHSHGVGRAPRHQDTSQSHQAEGSACRVCVFF